MTPDIFPSIIQVTVSLFQLDDLELSGLSANLLSSLVLPDLLEDTDSEIFLVFAKSFCTVESNSEIYGFSTLIYDLCYNVSISQNEQSIIIEGIQNHFNTKMADMELFVKKKLLKIIETQIDSSMEESTVQLILQLLTQLIEINELHSDIFQCFSSIIEYFPTFSESIFENLVPVAIDSLMQNADNQDSLLYFFNILLSNETIQYYQEIIPILLHNLLSILESEVDVFKSEASDLLEKILLFYNGDVIQLIQSQTNKNDLSILIGFCVVSKLNRDEVNGPFIASMINSENPRERYMAIRCVKKMVKSGKYDENLVGESVKHFDDDFAEIQIELIDLVGELSKNEGYPIEVFFEVILNFYMCPNPYLYAASYSTLRKIIKKSNNDRLFQLVPLVLSQFESCISNEETHEILISLSTIIQSLAIRLEANYSPFADHSLELLQQMSTIDGDFLIHSLTPIAFISSATKTLPFLDEFLTAMIGALRTFCEEQSKSGINEDDENFVEEVETMIDAVITSLRFLMKSFDIQNFVGDFLNVYFQVFEITHYFKIFGGFSDILTRYDEFVEVVGQQLFELITSSASEIASYINDDDDDDDDDDDMSDAISVSSDLLNLMKIFASQIDIDQTFAEFAFHLIELCMKFIDDENEALKYVLLCLVSELSKKIPNETFEFIQNHEVIKEAVLFGLNDEEIHDVSQNIVNIFGPESF